jgi:hypothetical protein
VLKNTFGLISKNIPNMFICTLRDVLQCLGCLLPRRGAGDGRVSPICAVILQQRTIQDQRPVQRDEMVKEGIYVHDDSTYTKTGASWDCIYITLGAYLSPFSRLAASNNVSSRLAKLKRTRC